MAESPIGYGVEDDPIGDVEAWAEPAVAGGKERVLNKVRRWGDAMNQALIEAQSDQDMFDGFQWTDEELDTLRARGQPPIVANRIKPAINGIVGVIEKGRTDPKAYPRNPEDEQSAELATDVLRYVADRNRFPSLKAAMLTDELIWGWTSNITEVDEDRNTNVRRIRSEEFIWDPSSRERDLSDASFLGIGQYRFVDDVELDFPDVPGEQILNALTGADATSDGAPSTMEDRPWAWADTNTKRVFQAELYHREKGVWYRTVMVRGLVLAHGESVYVDPITGFTRCPIEGVRAYVDRKNQPYGLVRDMRDPQRELNMRRSRILHEAANRQVMIEEGAVDDVENFRLQMARADGVPIVAAGALDKVKEVQRGEMVQYQFLLLNESKNEIERQGPNPGVLGRDVKGQSGRAILAQTQAGLLELATVLGWFNDYELRTYRQMWLCSQQFGTPQDFARIIDNAGKAKFVRTWEEVPVIDPMTGQQATQPAIDPQTGQPAIDPTTGGPVLEPLVERKNRLAQLDVDLVLDSSPDVAVIEEEQFQVIAELLPVIAGIPSPQVQQALPELIKRLLRSSQLRDKNELAEAMDTQAQPDPQQQAMQQEGLRIQHEMALAEVDKVKSETVKNLAAADKSQADAADIIHDNARADAGMDGGSQDREAAERRAAFDRAEKARQADADRDQRERQFQPREPGGR